MRQAHSVVLLTSLAPSRLAEGLALAGVNVWEALSVSEVLHLCATERVDAIVIGSGIEDPELAELRGTQVTLELQPEATAVDVLWELSQLFPNVAAGILQ
jgi:hypothetical protein